MTLGIALFAVVLLLLNNERKHHQPLLLLLFCLGILATGPVVFQLFPVLRQVYIAALPLVFFTLLPSLWLYHLAVTSKEPWRWSKRATKHYLPLWAVAVSSVLVVFLPQDEFNQMFFTDLGIDSMHATIVAYGFFITLLAWCGLSTLYVFSILKHAVNYRRQLRQVFADESGRSLRWIDGLTVFLLVIWVYALLVLAFENQLQHLMISENGLFLLLLLFVWFLATNGVLQKPGFADLYNMKIEEEGKETSDDAVSDNKAKYQRSALGDDQAQRIAEKLQFAIQQEKVYLDPELTLYKLAAHIGVPNQYLSQTLSQSLQTTFFDYINQARIEAAKPLLQDTENTVLSIAMDVGFNARSSFYKAFKQYTGLTPSEFRKQN